MTLLKSPQNITPLLEPSEVSRILGVTVKSLAVWRCTKRYALPYIKVGKSVRYRSEDVQTFINSREVAQ
jgi:hypothetical protein